MLIDNDEILKNRLIKALQENGIDIDTGLNFANAMLELPTLLIMQVPIKTLDNRVYRVPYLGVFKPRFKKVGHLTLNKYNGVTNRKCRKRKKDKENG